MIKFLKDLNKNVYISSVKIILNQGVKERDSTNVHLVNSSEHYAHTRELKLIQSTLVMQNDNSSMCQRNT